MSERGAAADNIVGNVYDKYGTTNPIARALMQGFLGAVSELYITARPRTVLEVGCGEGRLAAELHAIRPAAERFEITDVEVDNVDPGLPGDIVVRRASAYELPYEDGEFDLVVCCEVLEHLEDPPAAMRELARVAGRHVLVSVPWEPVWRMLNMARGRYLRDLGNTPGHVQHFSRSALVRLCRRDLSIVARRTPLPWTIILGAPLRDAR